MDERRTVEIAVPADRAGRGTAIWLQILTSIVLLAAAGAGWWLLDSAGMQRTLASIGIELPFAPAADVSATPAAAPGGGGQSAGRPGGGGPGGGPGGLRGNRAPALVVTEPVSTATINDRLASIGEGSAARAVVITSPSGGTVEEILVAAGDRVPAGAVIARLDSDTEQIAFDRVTLAIEDARAALERASELAAAQSIPATQLRAAQLAADQAELELRNAQLALERRTISTPIAGRVGLLQVSPGNAVTAQTVVTTVEDSSEILVDFWVPERYASAIEVGEPVEARAIALPGQVFSGTVSALDNRIDPQSRTLQVQAHLPNNDGRIRPGMSFQVAMAFPGESFPMVDPLSIQWSSEGAYVWKYVEGTVERAMVEIIERNSGGVLVRGDVAAGDAVVTQGVLALQPGQNVRLLDEPRGEGRRAGQQGGGRPGAQQGGANPG